MATSISADNVIKDKEYLADRFDFIIKSNQVKQHLSNNV